MATLEIHEVGHRVRRVRIGRSHPVMLGTNPLCDVPLNDPSLRAFHGRIRWSKTKFKVEAVEEVPFIEVNGSRIKSKSLRQGDEIKVGHTRIFLLSIEDDGPDHGEKTVVQEPVHAADFAGTPLDDAAAYDLGGEVPAIKEHDAPRDARPVAADYARMEMAPPSLELLNEEVLAAGPGESRSEPKPHAPLPRSSWRDRSRKTSLEEMDDLATDDPEDADPPEQSPSPGSRSGG